VLSEHILFPTVMFTCACNAVVNRWRLYALHVGNFIDIWVSVTTLEAEPAGTSAIIYTVLITNFLSICL